MTSSPSSTYIDNNYGGDFHARNTAAASTVVCDSSSRAAVGGQGCGVAPVSVSHSGHDRIGLDMAAAEGAQSTKARAFGEAAVWELVTSFKDGDKGTDFWNGDVAAAEGHLGLMRAKHLQGNPLSYTHLAVSRAAKNGRLDVVTWLHNYTDVPQVPSAMDSAAAGGHLEVSKKQGCTRTRCYWGESNYA